ncbi:hypothetical protein Mapa_009307 [Marchantia paleacea]|nr:hypothetical protein Mapa_009307 [Marchantia paleacea]
MGALKTYLFCRLILEHCVQFVTLSYIQCFVKSLILDVNHGRIPSNLCLRLAPAWKKNVNAFRLLNAPLFFVLMGRVNQHHQTILHQISHSSYFKSGTDAVPLERSQMLWNFDPPSLSWHPLLPSKFETHKSPMTWPVLL